MNRKERILLFTASALFILSGIGTLIIADRNYSTPIPAEGGSIKEGLIGTPHRINPLLAVSSVDRDLVELIYAGLMRADGKGGLEVELAESYEVSEDGLVYTFWLKKDLYWHDNDVHENERVDADDVIFTIMATKNPLIDSPKRANWEGVSVEKVDEYTVRFILKRPYTPFLENTTLGIIPQHIWGKLTPEKFNLTDLNITPIGAGPYKVESFKKKPDGEIVDYNLVAHKKYKPRSPYINELSFFFFPSEERMIQAYKNGDIDTFSISSDNASQITNDNTYKLLRITLPRIFTIFLNQSKSKLFEDEMVRLALESALDRNDIINTAVNGYAYPQDAPIFYTTSNKTSINSNAIPKSEVKSRLLENGWEENENGILQKETKKEVISLSFTLSTSDDPELIRIAEALKRQWKKAGITANVEIFERNDLEQNKIRPREYEAILFGQVVGFRPDPFAFWHSSQRNDPGLNIALYTNPKVDSLLEEIRVNTDREILNEKYGAFVNIINEEKPAIFLYSPVYLYFVKKDIQGIALERITLTAERFTKVEQWYKNVSNVWNILLK